MMQRLKASHFNFYRISVIFRVRSAKAVKITDASLIKKVGILCGFVSVALLIRTLVSPPDVIVGRTADNLKAFLCKTDWWDHTFTSRKWITVETGRANWISLLLFQSFLQSRCCSWLGAFGCALWCEKHRLNSTRVASYQWPFTTSFSSLASSTFRCKSTFLSSCLHFFCWFRFFYFSPFSLSAAQWRYIKFVVITFRAGFAVVDVIAMPLAATQQKFKLSPPAAKKLSICLVASAVDVSSFATSSGGKIPRTSLKVASMNKLLMTLASHWSGKFFYSFTRMNNCFPSSSPFCRCDDCDLIVVQCLSSFLMENKQSNNKK